MKVGSSPAPTPPPVPSHLHRTPEEQVLHHLREASAGLGRALHGMEIAQYYGARADALSVGQRQRLSTAMVDSKGLRIAIDDWIRTLEAAAAGEGGGH